MMKKEKNAFTAGSYSKKIYIYKKNSISLGFNFFLNGSITLKISLKCLNELCSSAHFEGSTGKAKP